MDYIYDERFTRPVFYVTGTRKRWESISYNEPLREFIYSSKHDLKQEGFHVDSLSTEDWLRLRRWLPLLGVALTDEEKRALEDVLEDIFDAMLELGRWIVIVWLIRKRRINTEEKEIDVSGDGNVLGDNSNSNVTNNITVIIGSAPKQGESLPILAIREPDRSIRFIPLAANYSSYDKNILEQAVTNLGSKDLSERVNAIQVVKERGDTPEVDALTPLLDDSELMILKLVADVIGERRYQKALPKLMDILSSRKLPEYVGEAIVFALLELGDENVIPFLAGLYHKYNQVRYIEFPLSSVCLTQDKKFDVLLDATKASDKLIRLGAVSLLSKIFESESPPEPSNLWERLATNL